MACRAYLSYITGVSGAPLAISIKAILRELDAPVWNELTDKIASIVRAKKRSEALNYGAFKDLVLSNKYCVLERETANDRVMVAVNMEDHEVRLDFNARAGRAHDLITGGTIDFGGGLRIPANTAFILEPY